MKEIHCTYDPKTRGGWSNDGRKIKGTLHWVSADHAIDAEIRLYEHLFNTENPEADGKDFINDLNPNSLKKIKNAKLEPWIKKAKREFPYQFLRNGYFCFDSESTNNKLIFKSTIELAVVSSQGKITKLKYNILSLI